MGTARSTEPLISVVVVTHDSGSELDGCLESILGTPPAGVEMDVVVVDSGSADLAYLATARRRFPSVRVLRLSNYGYGTAINAGARASHGRYLVPVNPDVRIDGATILRLVRVAEDNRLAAIGPRLVDGAGVEWSHDGYGICPPWRRAARQPLTRYPDYRQVDVLRGAVLVLSRALFDEVNGFDERFFLYSEEDDLLARMAARGGRFGVADQIWAVHAGQASSSGVSDGWRAAQRVRGRRRYVAKHYSAPEAVIAVAVDLLRSWRRLPVGELRRLLVSLAVNPRRGLPWPATPQPCPAPDGPVED